MDVKRKHLPFSARMRRSSLGRFSVTVLLHKTGSIQWLRCGLQETILSHYDVIHERTLVRREENADSVMPAWIAGIQPRKDALS